jgi:hypothetical protein
VTSSIIILLLQWVTVQDGWHFYETRIHPCRHPLFKFSATNGGDLILHSSFGSSNFDFIWMGGGLLTVCFICEGMGFESARAFAAKGWQTTLACRSVDRAQQARRKIMYNYFPPSSSDFTLSMRNKGFVPSAQPGLADWTNTRYESDGEAEYLKFILVSSRISSPISLLSRNSFPGTHKSHCKKIEWLLKTVGCGKRSDVGILSCKPYAWRLPYQTGRYRM